jgi:hypothetical protein
MNLIRLISDVPNPKLNLLARQTFLKQCKLSNVMSLTEVFVEYRVQMGTLSGIVKACQDIRLWSLLFRATYIYEG